MKPLAFVLFCLLLLPLSTLQPSAAASPPTVSVEQHVILSGSYALFSLNVVENSVITANVTLPAPATTSGSLVIQTFMTPSFANGTVHSAKGSLQVRPNYTAPARVVNPWTFVFPIPANTTSAEFTIGGTYTGSSILWKNQIQVGPIVVFGLGASPEYQLVVSSSHSTVLKKVIGPDFDYNTTASAGVQSITSKGPYPDFLVILYQPSAWDIVAWVLLALAVILIIMFSAGRLGRFLPKRPPNTSALFDPARRLWKTLGGLDSHKFLSLFVITSILMLSLSFMAGPDPRVKVFVIASGSTTKDIRHALEQSLGSVQVLTPSDTESEFNTMATLGTVQVVVVSNYDKLDYPSVEKYIIDSLDLVPLTIVVAGATPDLANYTNRLYNGTSLSSGTTLMSVQTPADVGSKVVRDEILRIVRPNNLGLGIGVTSFMIVAGVVGILSFLVVTFGVAFLASKLIEAGAKPLVSSLVEGVFYSGGVFFFIQANYMASSALLGWPLGLHAVTSGSTQLTVIGMFHLGAGNDPRTLAALIGLIIGAVPTLLPRIDRYLAIAVGALVFFVVVDPLTGGTVFFEFATMLTGGPQVGFANATLLSVKSFLNQIGTDAAGWISGNFGISSGEMFYYLGAVPLALIPKLQKSTATLALIFCGFAASDGIVRVAEMTAYKTEPSMIAGVFAGLLLAVVLLAISRAEGLIRRYSPSRR